MLGNLNRRVAGFNLDVRLQSARVTRARVAV